MPRVRFDFLNWRPDLEAEHNQGLTKAENLVHEPEGYRSIPLNTAGAYVTTISATVSSCVAKPVGPQRDVLAAWISNDTLQIGVNGVTGTSPTTGWPVSFATTGSQQEITFFDVCEYANQLFFVAQAQQLTITPDATETISAYGYIDL